MKIDQNEAESILEMYKFSGVDNLSDNDKLLIKRILTEFPKLKEREDDHGLSKWVGFALVIPDLNLDPELK